MTAINLIKNNLSQAIQFGSRWGVNIVLALFLAKEQFANFSYIYSISNILMGVVPFGSAIYLLKSDSINIKKTLDDSIILLIVFSFGIFFLYLILSIFFHGSEIWNLIILGIILGVIYSVNYIFYSFYKTVNKFNVELFSSFFIFVFSIPLILYVYLNNDVNIVNIFYYLIFLNLICTIWLLKISEINFFRLIKRVNKSFNIFLERKYFGGQELLNTVINQFSLILLFYLLVKEDYAVFRTMLILMSPFMLFTTATGQVVLLYLKKITGNIVLIRGNFIKIQIITLSLGVIIYLFMWAMYPLISSFFDIGEKYKISYLILMTTIVLRLCLSNNEMFLVVIGQQKSRFFIMLFSAILSLAVIVFMTPMLGMMSAVIANIMANVILIVCSAYFVFKYLRST